MDSTAYPELPEELRVLPNWVVWRREKRANKSGVVNETKVPYNARTKKHAKSNNPATWSSFDDAIAALRAGGYDGLGFCFTPPLVGVDLDGCRPNGTDEDWATEIIRELGSYAELSPSGRGVHVIVKGELPLGRRQKDFDDRPHHGVGLYDAARGRYFTMTGSRIGGNGNIAERTAELRRIHARLFPPAKAKTAATGGSDDDLIERAKNAKNGGKFARLFDGRWEGDYQSQSEADLALCMKLAFWTNRDAGRIDALFRRSGLMRISGIARITASARLPRPSSGPSKRGSRKPVRRASQRRRRCTSILMPRLRRSSC
jgi:putative DNA primase/helicase